jgi:hypothetical protein
MRIVVGGEVRRRVGCAKQVSFFSRFSTMESSDFCADFLLVDRNVLVTKRNVSRTLHAGCAMFLYCPKQTDIDEDVAT